MYYEINIISCTMTTLPSLSFISRPNQLGI
jgi:hypothetical protein